MGGTTLMDCMCCGAGDDCINGLCQCCSDYNYKLQKQVDLLTLGLLQEKGRVSELEDVLDECVVQLKGHYGCSKNGLDGCCSCNAIAKAEQALEGGEK